MEISSTDRLKNWVLRRAMKERNIVLTTEAQLDWLHLAKELPYKTRRFRKYRRDEKMREKK
jgi:hypothetical protein